MAAAYDLAIIGGGINGCGIARDAAGRGLSVFLCEQGDLGGATSSASTKLIHGGLRYLERFAFRLVRESLAEREALLAAAPHIVRPLRLVLPHHKGFRPWPVIRLGLFVYDHLGGRRSLPPTRSLDLTADPAGRGLKDAYRRALAFSDCQVDDARLVILNARDAADRGAAIRPRTECVAARRAGDRWRLTLKDRRNGAAHEIEARALVNAAGPWVTRVLSEVAGRDVPVRTRLVKGSHIVVDRVLPDDKAYVFQNSDGRVAFAIPFEGDFTLIGTTDEDFAGDPATAAIGEAETAYLIASVDEYLEKPIRREAIRMTFAGVRPLHDDGRARPQETTRDYVLALDAPSGAAPLMSVIGGKLTTYRRLAERVLRKLAGHLPALPGPWTRQAKLPGGDIPGDFDAWARETGARYPFLDARLTARLCRAYGTRIEALLAGVSHAADMGADFGAGLTARELDFLAATEWAETAEDVLWRRTKLGLRIPPEKHAAIEAYLGKRAPVARH